MHVKLLEQDVISIELVIVQRIEHSEDPSQFAAATELDKVQLPPSSLWKARLSKGEHINGQIEPNVSFDRGDWDSRMQLVYHQFFGTAVQDYTAFRL